MLNLTIKGVRTMISNLKNAQGRAVANQFVINTDIVGIPTIGFQSYASTICYWVQDGDDPFLVVGGHWDYSHTTKKYMKLFINNYTDLNYENTDQFMKLIEDHPSIFTCAGHREIDLKSKAIEVINTGMGEN